MPSLASPAATMNTALAFLLLLCATFVTSAPIVKNDDMAKICAKKMLVAECHNWLFRFGDEAPEVPVEKGHITHPHIKLGK
uniref:Dirigent protein n=1 Tax=Steinernema glaseri TaxID=37863 RepID=A0A1I7ZWV0_9BILA